MIRDGVPIRPDWEKVVRPVLDYALARPEVDEGRVILAGWSFGGFLAPRAAGFDHRIAALWADPGQWDQRPMILGGLPLSDEEKTVFPDGVDPHCLDAMEQSLRSPDADPFLRWTLAQRGPWVHGTDTVFEYLADAVRFEVSPVAANIRCPTMVTAAEGDPIAAGAQKLFDAVGTEHKVLIRFTKAEGAGGHCEAMARHLFHQRCYDWLDDTLGDG